MDNKRLNKNGEYFSRGDIFEPLPIDLEDSEERKEAKRLHNEIMKGRLFHEYRTQTRGTICIKLDSAGRPIPDRTKSCNYDRYHGFCQEIWKPEKILRDKRVFDAFSKLKSSKRNIEKGFALVIDDFKNLVEKGKKEGCAYCGCDLFTPDYGINEVNARIGKEYIREQAFSIDRIDNNKGYYPDNVQQLCMTCNTSKGGAAGANLLRNMIQKSELSKEALHQLIEDARSI